MRLQLWRIETRGLGMTTERRATHSFVVAVKSLNEVNAVSFAKKQYRDDYWDRNIITDAVCVGSLMAAEGADSSTGGPGLMTPTRTELEQVQMALNTAQLTVAELCCCFASGKCETCATLDRAIAILDRALAEPERQRVNFRELAEAWIRATEKPQPWMDQVPSDLFDALDGLSELLAEPERLEWRAVPTTEGDGTPCIQTPWNFPTQELAQRFADEHQKYHVVVECRTPAGEWRRPKGNGSELLPEAEASR